MAHKYGAPAQKKAVKKAVKGGATHAQATAQVYKKSKPKPKKARRPY